MPSLTGLPALDVAIGMALLYLILSLLCSAVQEAIASVLNWRATMLEQGVRNLLGGGFESTKDPDARSARAAYELYQHPLINALYRERLIGTGQRLPSYIAPRTFALALLDTFAPDAAASPDQTGPKAPHDIIADTRAAIIGNDFLPGPTKRAITTILDQSRGDIDRARQGIEQWYNDAMARVSGWYKRKAQVVLSVLALLVAVGLNVDSVVVAQALWKQPALRAAVVSQADKLGGTGQTGTLTGAESLDQAANAVDQVKKLQLPIGWSSDKSDPRHVSLSSHLLAKIAGWAATLLALSLGAPFWFDTLSRLSRLRGSGTPTQPAPAAAQG